MIENDGMDDALRGTAQIVSGLISRAAEMHARDYELRAREREREVNLASAQAEHRASRLAAEQRLARASDERASNIQTQDRLSADTRSSTADPTLHEADGRDPVREHDPDPAAHQPHPEHYRSEAQTYRASGNSLADEARRLAGDCQGRSAIYATSDTSENLRKRRRPRRTGRQDWRVQQTRERER